MIPTWGNGVCPRCRFNYDTKDNKNTISGKFIKYYTPDGGFGGWRVAVLERTAITNGEKSVETIWVNCSDKFYEDVTFYDIKPGDFISVKGEVVLDKWKPIKRIRYVSEVRKIPYKE
jgi:hypothetical protein